MPKVATKGKGKRYPLNMRTTKEVRDQLERAAAASGRSLVQEVERRLEDSFTKEEAFREWIDIYRLMRSYLGVLAIIRKMNGEATADALHVGFHTIIDAACSGPLSEKRLKELQLEIIPELGKRGGNNAAGIATDALNVLSAVGLADLDPHKLSKWIKEMGAERAR